MSKRSKWRLTQEGLAELETRFSAKEQTLESKAFRMKTAIKTTRKILNREGNDRVVLTEVLERLDIAQPEVYVESIPVEAPELRGCATPENPLASLLQEPAQLPTSRRHYLVAALLVASVITFLAFTPSHRPQVKWLDSYKKARTAYHSGRYSDAAEALTSLTRSSINDKAPSARAEAIRLEGDLLAAKGDLVAAIDRYRRALVIHDEFQQVWGRASVLEALGVAEARLGHFEVSKQYLKESIEGLQRCGDFRGVASAMRSLGWVYSRKTELAEARKWFNAAAVAMECDPDPLLLTDLKAQQAMLLSAEGRSDSALQDLQECLTSWKEQDHTRWIATTMRQIALVYWDKSEPTQAMQAMDQAKQLYETAGDYLNFQECASWLSKRESEALRSVEGNT